MKLAFIIASNLSNIAAIGAAAQKKLTVEVLILY